MIIPVGKYRGKSVEWLLLKAPGYVKWMLEESAITGPLAAVKTEALRLISVFDRKQILKECRGRNCLKAASQLSAYQGNSYDMYAWCDTCDPYQAGAARWKLRLIRTYKEALDFIQRTCDGRRSAYRAAIDTIAIAKGFPDRSSQARLKAFFSESHPDANA
jgi:hypothetical protein